MGGYRSLFFLASSHTNLLNQKLSVFGHICSSGTVRSWTSSHFRSASPTTSNIAHVLCRRRCHSSRTFLAHLPLYCVALGVASDRKLVSFTLLFGERNQPVTFLPQKLYKNELLEINAEYFQTPMGQLHARVINTTNAIYCHGFISYSRLPFMGFKRARLRLAVLNAYKGLPLIFYLLHKNRVQHGGPKKYFRILCS